MDDGSDLRRELEERNAEIERLRGLLVAKDIELGKATGRMLEMESYVLRLIAYARRAKMAVTRPGQTLRRLRERRSGERG
jgi:hypothetical protein